MRVVFYLFALILVTLSLQQVSAATGDDQMRRDVKEIACTLSQNSPAIYVETAPATKAAAETDIDDCERGQCHGLSCHCACHGIAAALPAVASDMPYSLRPSFVQSGGQRVVAHPPLPPVPPPQI